MDKAANDMAGDRGAGDRRVGDRGAGDPGVGGRNGGERGGSDAMRKAIAAGRSALFAVATFSFATNVLLFVVPLYMLQIYDRVVSSRNEQTLLALSLVAAFLLIVYATLEALRTRILIRVGLMFDRQLAVPVFDAVHRGHLRQPQAGHTQALADVDTVREFLTGAGLLAFCDAPWFPIFVAAAFLLHPLYGWVALAGSVVILGLTLLNEFATRRQLRAAARAGIAAAHNAQASLRNGEVLQAMGMLRAVRAVWERQHDEQLRWQAQASDRASSLVAATRGARMLLQVAILGTGGWLAIHREVSPGSIVAASILVGRALQPIELLVTHWKGFVATRGALGRIRTVLALAGTQTARMALPRPEGPVALEGVGVTAPGGTRPILRDITFALAAGEMLAVVGPSAAGKSTLVRAMVGVWPASAGSIRLDGHDIGHWHPEELGRHVGYLPQGVELFAGTVAQNIARFQEGDGIPGAFGAVDSALVIAAAREAGCHEMIQQLPDGYDTQIGDGGRGLSGGQRQRIGLARALYGQPSMVVLDEPSAHLDPAGEEALGSALATLRARGVTTVVVSHALGMLGAADHILLVRDGTMHGFGPREAMLAPRAEVPPARRPLAEPPAADRPAASAQR